MSSNRESPTPLPPKKEPCCVLRCTFIHPATNQSSFPPPPCDSIDGASLPPAYQPPEYTGPEPTAEIEGGKLYTGSCHCGAVKVALKSKPLDKTYDEDIVDCNCSHCRKVRPFPPPPFIPPNPSPVFLFPAKLTQAPRTGKKNRRA